MQQYNAAPLPFQGQKRNFVRIYRDLLATLPDDAIFVDLFGGSGLLSHATRVAKPNATVVYNDYDNYRQRIAAIPTTNALLARIRPLVSLDTRASLMRRALLSLIYCNKPISKDMWIISRSRPRSSSRASMRPP